MAVSTLAPRSDKGKTRESKPILVDDASLKALVELGKNRPMNFGVHPALAVEALKRAAQAENATVTNEDGTIELKRTSFLSYMRRTLAAACEYTGDLVVARGGNVVGVVSAFNTIIGGVFATARSFAEVGNLSEDQTKQMAFAQARLAIQANPSLAAVDADDDVLEALWSGNAESLIAEEEDEEDEDEDEE